MTKLTDAQLVILSKAAQREDRAVELPAQLTTRFVKALEVLIERGLLEDVPSERAMPVWRHAGDDNEPRALIITELGLVAIGVIGGTNPGNSKITESGETPAAGSDSANPNPVQSQPRQKKPHTKTPRHSAPAKAERPKTLPTVRTSGTVAGKSKPASKPTDRTPSGKTATVIKLLDRKDGASIAALIEATGWLPHSTRAALTGLRKKGYTIERGKAKDQTTTVYRIAKAHAGKAA